MMERFLQSVLLKTGPGVQLLSPLLAVPLIGQPCSFEVEGIAAYKTNLERITTGDARRPSQRAPGVTCNGGTNSFTKP